VCGLAVAAVLGQVGTGQNADRCAYGYPGPRQQQTADNRIGQPPAAARRRRALGEYTPVQRGEALLKQRDQNPAQPEQPESHGQYRHAQIEGVDQAPAPVQRHVHALTPSRRLRRNSSSRASTRTVKVSRKRIRPSDIKEAMCIGLSDSANSLASVAEIVVPGMNNEGSMRCALPITNVTAMVSPSALPSPNMMPPITP